MKKIFLILAATVMLSSCATTAKHEPSLADEEEAEKALFDGYPDDLPPVPEERLRAMLADIVERENRIVGEEERGEAVDEGNCTYLHTDGNTHLVSLNESAPYYYFRVRNGDPEIPVPNYMCVVYARATKKNMYNYFLRRKIARSMRDLAYRDPEESYRAAKSHEISLETTAEIGGVPYEIFFTDAESPLNEDAADGEIPETSDGGVEPTPILELKNIELDGKNWIKTQYLDKRTGETIANRKFIIYVIMGEEDSDIGEIITRSDENGYVYVKNIPDGECYGYFLDED